MQYDFLQHHTILSWFPLWIKVYFNAFFAFQGRLIHGAMSMQQTSRHIQSSLNCHNRLLSYQFDTIFFIIYKLTPLHHLHLVLLPFTLAQLNLSSSTRLLPNHLCEHLFTCNNPPENTLKRGKHGKQGEAHMNTYCYKPI